MNRAQKAMERRGIVFGASKATGEELSNSDIMDLIAVMTSDIMWEAKDMLSQPEYANAPVTPMQLVIGRLVQTLAELACMPLHNETLQ